ncbi:MAG: hypothetical protein WC840_02870 [Candidatus Peribacteraceae bacterium]
MKTLGTGNYPALRRLILGANNLGTDGADHLTNINTMPELTSLLMAGCRLSTEDAIRILSATIAKRLTYLDLQANPIDKEAFVLAGATHSKELMPMIGWSMEPDAAEMLADKNGVLVNLNNIKGTSSPAS